MIRGIVFALAALSTAFAEPPSNRYLSSSGNHVDITEAKPRGFGSYSDSAYDTSGFGPGSTYSSPTSSSENYNSGFSSGYSGSQSGSSGYSGSQSGSLGYSGSQSGSLGYSGSQSGSLGYSGSQSGSSGYSGSSSPLNYGSNSFSNQGSGFTPTYSPSLSYSSGGSSGYGGSYGSSSGGFGPKGQSRPSKPQSQSFGSPSYSPGVSSAYNTPLSHNEIEEQTDPSDPVKYEFAYEVNAPESGSEFGHRESRAGGVTTGQYHVLLPDGRLQTVDYLADKAGYRPTVTYQQTDRVATQLTQSRAIGKVSSTASPSGYGSLSVSQGSPVTRQAPHSSSGYGPIQRSQTFAASDFQDKVTERVSTPVLQALTENDQE